MQDLFVKRRRKNSIVSCSQHVTSPRSSVVRIWMFTIEGKMNLDMNGEKSCDTSPRLVFSISSSCKNNMKISIRCMTKGKFYRWNTKKKSWVDHIVSNFNKLCTSEFMDIKIKTKYVYEVSYLPYLEWIELSWYRTSVIWYYVG